MIDVKLHLQQRALYLAVGKAMSAWADVESQLCFVFAFCRNRDDIQSGYQIFWGHQAFKAKLKASNAAVKGQLKDRPILMAEWQTLFESLKDKSANRNKLAHGQVVSRTLKESGKLISEANFIPYFMSRASQNREWERLSAKDIQQLHLGFHSVGAELGDFTNTICSEIKS